MSPSERCWRLSCRAVLHSDCVVDVPRLMGNPKAALLGYGHHVILNPNVAKVYLELSEPNLEDQVSDLKRVHDALYQEGYDVHSNLALWRTLPNLLRANNFQVTAVIVGDELIAVEGGDTRAQNYGLAVDIGTTTVVGAIVNLNTGAVEAVSIIVEDITERKRNEEAVAESDAELRRFLDAFRRYFDFFFGELGGVATSPTRLKQHLETLQ